jgi:3-polyprenyl-4-hydroxybenzoate decarboxylase
MYKILVVVDEDIDINDDRQIQWALCYRMEPGTDDIVIIPNTRGGGLDMTGFDDILYGTGNRGRILLDATRKIRHAKRDEFGNLDWGPMSYDLFEPERTLIDKRWGEYGIKLPEKKKK